MPYPVAAGVSIEAERRETAVWEGSVLSAWRRVLPFILTGVLLFNLADAIINGGQGNWIRVAIMALVLAFTIWWQRRTEP